jgi:hypothetical protein
MAVNPDTVILERVLSIHPVTGWNAQGKPVIQCSQVRAAISAGAAFVRLCGDPPDRPVYRVLEDGNLQRVVVRWVMEVKA